MNLNYYALSPEQAEQLSAFILPYVRRLPEKQNFWYLAAAEQDAGFIGMAVIAPYLPEAELLSIAVSPAYTRLGVATGLLHYALEKLRLADISALRVTCALSRDDWEPLNNLMEHNGFLLEGKERYSYRATLSELLDHPVLSAEHRTFRVHALSELSDIKRKQLAVQVASKKLFDPETLTECDENFSFIYEENNVYKAIFLLSPLENGELTNLYTWVKSGDSKVLVKVLQQALKKVRKHYPEETKLLFVCTGDASDKLIRHILPKAEIASVLRTYWHSTKIKDTVSDSDRIAYWNDLELLPVDASDLVCADCRYHRKESISQCEKYIEKPGNVLYGGECRFFESKENCLFCNE